MDRRTVLATAGSVLPVAVSGCLGTMFADETETPGRPWNTGNTTEDQDGAHHLFVENYTDKTMRAWLRVSDLEGAILVDGRYELPDGRGIKFAEIAAWQTTYTIELAIDGEAVTALEWTTPDCGPDSEAPGESGSRNATVRVKEPVGDDDQHQISLVVDECDAGYGPGLPNGPAETFRLDQ